MTLLPLVPVLPLLAAFLQQPVARASQQLGALLGPAALLGSAVILLQLLWHYDGTPLLVGVGGFAPPVGIAFYGDQLALLFASLVMLLGLLFWPWRRLDDATDRNRALTLLVLAACSGLAISGDLFNLFVFYELASIASIGLILTSARPAAAAAALRYLYVSGLGSVFALIGIAIIYLKTGSLNLVQLQELAPQQLANGAGLAAFALMLIGFGVKAELFPVNTWVPEVYAAASSRVSALLAGLVSKLAVLILVRILVQLFPLPEAGELMLILGLLGLASGELAAWQARDFPRMLAFSSIGQLGIVFIAFSLPGPLGILAGTAVALHHLVVKPGLFALSESWGRSLAGLAGAGRRSPLAAALFVLFALSLVGVPPLPGFWTKMLVLSGLAQQAEPLHYLAFGVLLAVTALEAGYLFRVAVNLYGKAEPSGSPTMRTGALVTSAVFGLALLAAAVLINPLGDALSGMARAVHGQAAEPARLLAGDRP